MCEPASLAIAGLAITAISTGVSVYSQYQQAQSQNKANDYNAQLMERNAQNAKAQGQYAVDQGAVDEANQRNKVRQLVGSQRAAASASGLLVDSGTTQDYVSESTGFGELDALTIRNNAARAQWGYENQAADYTGQAGLKRMGNTNPMLAAGGSLLSGGSKLAGDIYSYNKVGAFG